jgi:hypothetical protein
MSIRAEDRMVTAISRWLARHADDAELRGELDDADGELTAGQAEAVGELIATLDDRAPRADVEMVARETLEALALGA